MTQKIMLDVSVGAPILWLALYLIAKEEADYSFAKVSMVAAGLFFTSLCCELYLRHYLGFFTIVPMLFAVIGMIAKFCWVPWPKAAAVTGVFFVANMIVSIVWMAALDSGDDPLEAAMRGHDEDREVAMEFLKDVAYMHGMPADDVPASAADAAEEIDWANAAPLRGPELRGQAAVAAAHIGPMPVVAMPMWLYMRGADWSVYALGRMGQP